MRVKPLKWRDKSDGGVSAHSLIGMFTIDKVEGGFVYCHHQDSGQTKGCRATMDEAKQRCFEIVEKAIIEAVE